MFPVRVTLFGVAFSVGDFGLGDRRHGRRLHEPEERGRAHEAKTEQDEEELFHDDLSTV